MGLIFNTRNKKETDFSKMNHLSPEMKVLIVNAQTLVNDAKKIQKEKCYDFDMTAKMQLRDDCKAVEKMIEEIARGKTDSDAYEKLENLSLRLNTTLKGLLSFF